MPGVLVAIGSALGGLARYWLGIIRDRGVLHLTAATRAMPVSGNARLLTGLCGGFTTFSAFSLQSVQLPRSNDWASAAASMAGSVLLCVETAALGCWLGSRFAIPPMGES